MNIIDTMRRAAEALEATDYWRPIESAPIGAKGYAWMMLSWGPEDDPDTAAGIRCGDRFFAACTFYCTGNKREYEFREVEVRPTHWAPMPIFRDGAINSAAARITADIRAVIAELESAELPKPVAWRWPYKTGRAFEIHSHDFAVLTHMPCGEPLFTRDQLLAFRSGADKLWRDAVEHELVVAHILNESHADPRKAVQDAISWNVQVALDPAVSSDAMALIEHGRAAGRAPLTDDQIAGLWMSGFSDTSGESMVSLFARAVERAHGIVEVGNAER